MPKRTKQQEEQRLWNIGHADLSEKERFDAQIADNRELQKELGKLRQHFRISFRSHLEQIQWIDSQPHEVLVDFSKTIESIKEKYGITEKMNDSFWSEVWNLPKSGWITKRILGGMPKTIHSKKDGLQLVITPETDIRNPLVIEFIEIWQKKKLEEQTPPQPEKMKGSRKLDWRPVWEWSLRHPQVTRKDLAKKLNRNYTEVKRKLKQLDDQLEEPPFWLSHK